MYGKYDPIEIDLPTFKKVFNDWDDHLKDGGWGSIFLGNHDFSRMVSRFGNDQEYREQSAKLLATLLFTLRGTVYVYQGDEIGMTNVAYPSIEDYDDVETHGAWKDAMDAGKDMNEFMKVVHDQSRDNARTPIQWSSQKNAGFTEAKPWIKINENYSEINVEDQEKNSASVLNYYREIIAFRKEHLVFVYGDYESLDDDNQQIYAYRRWNDTEEYLVVHNFSDTETEWNFELHSTDYELVKSNLASDDASFTFAPWESKVFRKM